MKLSLIAAVTLALAVSIPVMSEGSEGLVHQLELSAKEGSAKAEFSLGNIYLHGLEGIAQDSAKGFQYTLKSAEHGFINAQYRVAVLYGSGQDTPKDIDKSRHWYSKAAKQGHTKAQYELAVSLWTTNTNYNKTIDLLNEAAKSGLVKAQILLAGIYLSEEDAATNPRLAYIWYSVASEITGESGTARLRDSTAKELDKKTISGANKEIALILKNIKQAS